MAVLQAWPGRGYWSGGEDGTLVGMIGDMAGLNQPGPQSAMINGFANFTSDAPRPGQPGRGRRRSPRPGWPCWPARRCCAAGRLVLRVAVPVAIVFCLAVWVLVQDFGIPGGLGTDPNSMLPWVLLVWTGYRVATVPSRSEQALPGLRPALTSGAFRPRVPAFRIGAIREAAARAASAASARSVTSAGAFAAVFVGIVPLAFAATNPNADPLIARAIAGPSLTVNRPAPDFRLVSQAGQPVSAGLAARAR